MRLLHFPRLLLVLGLLPIAIVPIAGRPLGAQATPTVDPSDPAYDDLQRLLASGLLRGAGWGQAPYSRRTVARLALEADSALASAPAPNTVVLRLACDRLLARFADDVARLRGGEPAVASHAFAETRLDLTTSDSPRRPVGPNGLGSIEADLNPLLDGREGRHLDVGTNLAFESEHWLSFGSHVALDARPRVWVRTGAGQPAATTIDLLTANARFTAGNVALTVGREFTDWSNAPDGGLFFSQNAPGLDMVRVASEEPFRLPSLLHLLGPARATLQVADLGPSTSHSHSLLVAYTASAHPSSTLEVGATFANHFGGEGAVNPDATRRIIDLLPFVDVFRHHADSTDFDSDKLLGMDARLRVPALANATLFSEMALEDFDVHRLRSIFTEDAAYIAGVLLPAVVTPAMSAQLAYHVTGIRFYEHHLLRNGIAASRATLGDDLGRDASGWYGTLTWEDGGGLIARARAAYESRGSTEYTGAYTQPGQQSLVFSVVAPGLSELRRRLVGELAYRPRDGHVQVRALAGAEHVSGAPGGARPATHGLGEASVSIFR